MSDIQGEIHAGAGGREVKLDVGQNVIDATLLAHRVFQSLPAADLRKMQEFFGKPHPVKKTQKSLMQLLSIIGFHHMIAIDTALNELKEQQTNDSDD